jgi:hypothetical protein
VAYLARSLTLAGGYSPLNWTTADPAAYPTTLDAQGQGRVVVVAGEITVTLTGLNLTNGNADGLGGLITTDEGGGLLILTATVTLRDSQVYSNSAYMGGGICVARSHPDIVGNAIYDNSAGSQGGGVHLRFTGGTVRDNAIFDNQAHEQGGGVHVVYSDVEVSGNTIYGNRAPAGGGVTLSGYYPTLRGNAILNNVILNNGPQYRGSGVLIDSALGRKPTLLHNTLSGNTGSDGSGIHVAGANTVQLTNTVLVSHTVGITVSSGSIVTLTGALWSGNGIDSGGAGSISASNVITGDPAFGPDGYHLTENSIARDSGVNSGVPDDIDGNSRPQVAGYDLGADEFVIWHYIYLPLVFRNSG